MAKHETVSTLPGLTGERIKAIVALAVNLGSAISAGLALAGLNPLPFTDDQISAAVFAVITVASSIYNWWTHLTVTEAGYQGKQLTTAIKNGPLSQGIAAAPEIDPLKVLAAAGDTDTTDAANRG